MLVTFPTRLSFPNLFEPDSIDGGAEKYGAKFIIDPADTATIAKIEAAMDAVAKEKWTDAKKRQNIVDNFTRKGRKPDVCFVKEPYKSLDGEVWNGFEDMFYFSASNDKRPRVIDRDKSDLHPSDGKPTSGDYVVAQVDIWAQDNKFGKGIRATLKVVQFARKGESLGGGAAADLDQFEEIPAEDDESFV